MKLRKFVQKYANACSAWSHLIENLGREEAYILIMDLLSSDVSEEFLWWTYDSEGNGPKGRG